MREAGGGGPDVVLIATGSEVSLALRAADVVEQEGTSARVVSMPCWELFEQQDEAYQREVLSPDIPKVVVEAGIRQGWDRWAGRDAAFVTMDRFGASAPYEVLFERFGITVERIAAEVKALLS